MSDSDNWIDCEWGAIHAAYSAEEFELSREGGFDPYEGLIYAGAVIAWGIEGGLRHYDSSLFWIDDVSILTNITWLLSAKGFEPAAVEGLRNWLRKAHRLLEVSYGPQGLLRLRQLD